MNRSESPPIEDVREKLIKKEDLNVVRKERMTSLNSQCGSCGGDVMFWSYMQTTQIISLLPINNGTMLNCWLVLLQVE